MYCLISDSDKCDNCCVCENKIEGFKTTHKGVLPISSHRFNNDEEVKESCDSVILSCHTGAISVKKGYKI
jgi:ferredoxin